MERTTFASVGVKFEPTQIRGPIPKGIKAATLLLVALATPSENLCGLKRFTSSPHMSGSWWTEKLETFTVRLAGRVSFPSVAFLSTFLSIEIAGGYNLRASLMIMLICMGKNIIKKKKKIIYLPLSSSRLLFFLSLIFDTYRLFNCVSPILNIGQIC